MPRSYCGDILDTIKSFLDTCPELTGKDIAFGDEVQGESPDVLMLKVMVDEVEHLVIAKKVG